MQEQNPRTSSTNKIVPSAQRLSPPTTPISSATTPVSEPTTRVSEPTTFVSEPTTRVSEPTTFVTKSTKPITGSFFTDSDTPVLAQARLSHAIAALTITLSTVIAIMVWSGSELNDDWARRWVLVAIPFISAGGLCIGWRSAWRDILLGMAVVYLFAPFVAARVESCWLPIPGAVPCFADNKIVLEFASQLAHPIYYPVLIGLHLCGALFMWSLVASKGGQYAPSTGTTTD